MDFQVGPGVDLLLSDPYVLPLEDENCDVVVSSRCSEHSDFFGLLFSRRAASLTLTFFCISMRRPTVVFTGALWIAGAFIRILWSLFARGQNFTISTLTYLSHV